MESLEKELMEQLDAAKVRAKRNTSVDPNGLEAEISRIKFVPDLVPGDRKIVLFGQPTNVHETSALPYIIAAYLRYKAAIESDDLQEALVEAKKNAKPHEREALNIVEKNFGTLDPAFQAVASASPNLYESALIFSQVSMLGEKIRLWIRRTLPPWE